jgi:teichoic acid transport system ATP-binding protein
VQCNAEIENPIVEFTIKNKQGVEIAGTNNKLEDHVIESVKSGQCLTVSFAQKMLLQGGEYLLSFSCTGYEEEQPVVCHQLQDVCNIVVVENIRKVGFFDIEPVCEIEES